MCKFIQKFFLKKKSKKILTYIEELEKSLTIFKQINNVDEKTLAIVSKLSKNNFHADIVSRFNVYTQQIAIHNKKIQELCFAYNSILENYAIQKIIDNIFDYSIDKIEEIYETVKDVNSYVIPNSCKNKDKYYSYKSGIENVLRDYEIIKEQKRLLSSIYNEINSLPDAYIDDDNISSSLSAVLHLINTYNTYQHKYYKVPTVNAETIEKHNESFIIRHLDDTIFDNVNGKSLDKEQRRAILCNSKSNLTIAGAGSGKTLTICGKVKYLLETGLAKENEILLLSYSRNSADDLNEKVSKISKY